MLIYICIFIISLVLALYYFNKPKPPVFFFFMYCLAIGVIVGVSDMLGGYDRYIYGEIFQLQAWHLHDNDGLWNEDFQETFGKEPVFGLINSAIGLFTPNRYLFIFIFTLLMYLLLPISMYKYTKNPFFCLLVFLGLVFFFSFTYLRQVMACGVCWLSFPYVVKRKFIIFFCLVALATLIHNSAVYFLLLYFIPRKKYAPWKIVVFMMVLLLVGFTEVTKVLFLFSGDLVQNAKISGYSQTAEYGFRIEYVIESTLFLVILLKNYEKVKNETGSLVILNCYLMFCGLLLLFCRSSDGGRIAWYCTIGVMIMLTEFVSDRNAQFLRGFVSLTMFVLYLRIINAWGILLSPYKTFLTPGIRRGDFIREEYEYDYNYDADKFYNINFQKRNK
jgi:putative capsular polysaccharide biosynthesis protein